MADIMNFPKTIKEFIKEYEFKDKKEIYTNGSELIQVYRVKQALDYYDYENKINKLEKALDKACELLEISMSKIPIKYIPEGVDVFNNRYELKDGLSEAFGIKVLSNSLKNKEDWKDYLLKESEEK